MALFDNDDLIKNPALRRFPSDDRAWRTFIQSLNSQSISVGAIGAGARGWMTTTAFSATDADTVAWGAGTLTLGDGTAYSIGAGNTGNMAARTFIYFDSDVSTTAYQTTTTAANSVGLNKILVAVAEDATDEAFFQVFGGTGGVLLTGNELAANSVTANTINAGAVTASKLSIGKGGSTLNLDPEFSDESAWYANDSQVETVAVNGEWSIASGPVSGAPTGGGVITLNQDATEDLWSERIPIDDAKTYRVSIFAQQPSGTRNQYLCVDFRDDSGTQITGSGGGATGWTSTGTYHYWSIANANYASSWTRYEFTFGANGTATIPSGAVSCSIGALGNWNGTGTTRVDLNDYRLEEVIPGVLIEDGAITADQLAATITYTKELIVSSAGEVHSSGKDSFADTTSGFWVGHDGASSYDFVIGDGSESMAWDGSAGTLTVTGDLIWSSFQTFTPGWTGFSTDPTGTVSYLDLGTHAIIFFHASRTGTNTTAPTMTGVPSAIRPSTTVWCPSNLFFDGGGANRIGMCSISTGGVVTMYISQLQSTDQIRTVTADWSTGAGCGFPAGVSLIYPL